VRRARDKAKVEQGVLLLERWILARLRHRTFFSLAELNGAIAQRLEAACRRALVLNACRYKSIESILNRGLDRQPLPEQQELSLPEAHDHLRGPDYYHPPVSG